MKSFALATLAFLFTFSAQAEVRPNRLATITNSKNRDESKLSAMVTEEGGVRGIRFETKPAEPGAETRVLNFSLEQIESRQGAVLLQEETSIGMLDVIILYGAVDIRKGEGTLRVKYLSNGITSSYGFCDVLVKRNSAGKWQLINLETEDIVKDLFIQTHSLGVTTVRGICPR